MAPPNPEVEVAALLLSNVLPLIVAVPVLTSAPPFKPEELPFFRPAEQAGSVVPEADVLLITGTTLINDTLEELLKLAKPAARVTIVGPTVSLLPDAFLRRGADILGTVRITEPDEFLEMLAEGGSGYHFLGRSAQKVVLVRRSAIDVAA